ncbi:MAG: thrombospondin [Proteobacteria bacterium]|nr:thrombospondin [Pseudomonadota bacterium]
MKKSTQMTGLFLCLLAVFLWVGTADAQDNPPYECDDNFGECGTPQQSGGGGGGGGGSILINNTDLGDTYQNADDYDDDGHEDPFDNCPFLSNYDQADDDGDDIGSGCDNCPNNPNTTQEDRDGDGLGDSCDDDLDGDGVSNDVDLCVENPDPMQKDMDGDGDGDACDEDMDNDGVSNLEDNCPLVENSDQADEDPDRFGDACDDDDDGDGVRNTQDNCYSAANGDQDDVDEDGHGDVCDPDIDGDGITNLIDNCQAEFNPDQLDIDRDGLGQECDDLFCYVIDNDIENCLDPTDPFTIYTPDEIVETGADDFRLKLFSNRKNQPIRYTWTVKKAPPGSSATIDNPRGAATISPSYEYHYIEGKQIYFVPDKPGTYEIHVVAELVWEDEATGQSNATAETHSIIEATGEPIDSVACSVATVGHKRTNPRGTLLSLVLISVGMALIRL